MNKYSLQPKITISIRLAVLLVILLAALALMSCGGGGGDGATTTTTTTPACQLNNTAQVTFGNKFTDKTVYVVWDGATIVTLAPGETSAAFTESAGVAHTSDFKDAATNLLACTTANPNFSQCTSHSLTCGPP